MLSGEDSSPIPFLKEETEGNADADVDDGNGIRVFFFLAHSSAADDFSPWKDGVDEDTENGGENASKSVCFCSQP